LGNDKNWTVPKTNSKWVKVRFYTSQEKDRLPYALTDILHTPLSELNALPHHDI